MNKLLNDVTHHPAFVNLNLTPDTIVYGEGADLDSLVLVQLIAFVEDLSSKENPNLFEKVFYSEDSLTLDDLLGIIE